MNATIAFYTVSLLHLLIYLSLSPAPYLDDGEDVSHVAPGMQLDDGDDLGQLSEQVLPHVLITGPDHTQEWRHHLHHTATRSTQSPPPHSNTVNTITCTTQQHGQHNHMHHTATRSTQSPAPHSNTVNTITCTTQQHGQHNLHV